MTSSDHKQQWVREYFGRVDAGDADGFLSMIAENGTLVLGNADPVVGRANIGETLGGLVAVIRSCRHVLHAIHDPGDDVAAVEGTMEIVRQDGKELPVRFAAFFEIGGDGQAREMRLFTDFAPVFS